MRIALVVYDYSKPGGIEKYVRKLSAVFHGEGHDVHVITTSDKPAEIPLVFHKITVENHIPSFMRLRRFIAHAAEHLKKEKYDIVHSQGADCPVHNVITAHSCHRAWVNKSRNTSLWEYVKKELHPLHRIVIRNEAYSYTTGNYSSVIAVSNVVKREIMQLYKVPEQRIAVIYPGIDLAEFSVQNRMRFREKTRKEIGVTTNQFLVLLVANEFRRKGLSSILKAMARLKKREVKLLVVGKGSALPYRVWSLTHGIARQVQYIPQMPSISSYFAAADLFLLPTKHEAFGMVIAEAMACGLPVLVSKFAGAAELVKDERCLLEDPMDDAEIIEKFRYFVEHKEAGEALGLKHRKYVEELSWENVAKKTLQVYEATLEGIHER